MTRPVFAIDPSHMTSAVAWCNMMALNLGQFGAIPKLTPDKPDWRWWAQVVSALPGIQRLQPPDPYSYQDWRAWATRFNSIF